jgi:hypothetical protein
MTDDIKNAILGLHNGDSAQFKDAINSTLMNKAKDSIQLQRIYAGQTMFDDEKEEVDTETEVEVEQESEDDPESSEEISDEEI